MSTEESQSKTSGRNLSSGSTSANDSEAVDKHPLLVTQVGEKLETEYQVHELPTDDTLLHPVVHCLISLYALWVVNPV